ncbi:MAG TPA: cytochrome b/b6 domain-containing protein [Luteibacter sp.]|jgi:thiosulfate reductase cytochrome b subunit|nr:cytochrome b/b6 domain-containing protein [Luteibacter sp.]
MNAIDTAIAEPARSPVHTVVVRRHRWPVRLMHWINVLCLTLLLMSGLQIFNAHPSLSWGKASDDRTAWLSLGAQRTATGQLTGVTRLAGHEFDTTGVLGVSKVAGVPRVRGFPAWATVPGPGWLAMGRRWHFFFAWLFVINGLCYVGYSLFSRHLSRDLVPTRRDWRGIGHSILDHLRLRHPEGEEALRYNVLQRIAYLVAIFVFGGGIVLMGLAMSPRMDAVLGWMVDAVGGRQSARSIHFLIACGFVAFVLVHVFEVLITGPVNQLRGMITGRYRITVRKQEPSDD